MEKLNKNEWIAIVLALLVIVYVFFFSQKKEEPQKETGQQNLEVNVEEVESLKDQSPTGTVQQEEKKEVTQINTKNNMNELKIETVKEGTGVAIEVGQIAEVNYTGKLLDGTVFDSSIPRGKTFEFRLGEGNVIAGWEEGVKGMKVGEKRVLTIPGNMAYGSNGIPNGKGGYVIPPNATLSFEVDLVSIK